MPEVTGRPSYHPATLLKIYIYGYLNRIPSSRRLERETQRNLELIWLTGRLMPDFKTIADFRRDNGPAIRAACAQFVVLCRKLNLFTRAVVAIDGSKFKAVNNRDKNFTVAKVAKRIEQVEASIARYLAALDRADRQDSDEAEARTSRLKEKIEGLRRAMQSLKEMEQQVRGRARPADLSHRSGCALNGHQRQGHRHCRLQRPDGGGGRASSHRGARGDQCRQRPHPTAGDGATSPDVMGCEDITALADRGYYNGDEVLACEGTGVLPCVPKTQTSGNTKRGLFTGQDFVYDAEHDHYTCPAGQHLTRGKVRSDRRDNIDHYRNLTACSEPALSSPAARPDKHKRVKRWEHEDVLDRDAGPARAHAGGHASSADRRWSIRSGPSRPGWAAPTS